jgi:hypothetical protein
MNKKLIAFLSIFSLSLSLPLIPANAAVKAGASCKTLGITSVASAKTFTCIKSGKKLVWNKGVLNKTSKKIANDTYTKPSDLSDNIELCKIKEVNLNGPRASKQLLPTGFPSVTPSTQNFGTVKWALIPIEFPNFKGEANFRSRIDSQMKILSDWFLTVSDGKLKIDWVVLDQWTLLPKDYSEYAMPSSVNLVEGSKGANLFKDAMMAADPIFDFTNIQTVNFILPKGQNFISESVQGFPSDDVVKNVTTNEGKISSFSIPGALFDQVGRTYWSYWAHEFGHAISIAHVGASRGSLPPFSPFDLMGAQDGSTRELSGWLRFLGKWMPDEKVYCKLKQNLNTTELTLVPLNSSVDGFKMAVVPLSETKAIIIESRRFSNFSCGISSKNGVLVYVYDANLVHNEDFLIPIYPSGRNKEDYNTGSSPCNLESFSDPYLYQGDKVTFNGVTVENLIHGNFDKIKINKSGN